jgi:hypothetical protein
VRVCTLKKKDGNIWRYGHPSHFYELKAKMDMQRVSYNRKKSVFCELWRRIQRVLLLCNRSQISRSSEGYARAMSMIVVYLPVFYIGSLMHACHQTTPNPALSTRASPFNPKPNHLCDNSFIYPSASTNSSRLEEPVSCRFKVLPSSFGRSLFISSWKSISVHF